MSSNLESTLNSRNKILLTLILVVSFIGFADAAYLTIQHFMHEIPPCTIGGCETVLTSRYAELYGIPIALFGMLLYIAVFFSAKMRAFSLLKLLTGAGFVASLGLLYLQVFVIEAICLYCMVSLATSTLNFIFSLFVRNDNLEIFYPNR